MPETTAPTAGDEQADILAMARAAIAGLGHPAETIVLAAHGLDGHKASSAIDVARDLGYEPGQARVILMDASARLARGHRKAFDALVRQYGPERPAAVAADPWYRFAVTLTRGSLSRWTR